MVMIDWNINESGRRFYLNGYHFIGEYKSFLQYYSPGQYGDALCISYIMKNEIKSEVKSALNLGSNIVIPTYSQISKFHIISCKIKNTGDYIDQQGKPFREEILKRFQKNYDDCFELELKLDNITKVSKMDFREFKIKLLLNF